MVRRSYTSVAPCVSRSEVIVPIKLGHDGGAIACLFLFLPRFEYLPDDNLPVIPGKFRIESMKPMIALSRNLFPTGGAGLSPRLSVSNIYEETVYKRSELGWDATL